MKLLFRLIIIFSFFILLILVIAYARGYRLDFQKKSLFSTGILAITSTPKAAKIYINHQFKGVTDTNLNLPPSSYRVEIKKDGYTVWSKTVSLKGELVLSLDALLFPLNPSLSPLTNLGVIKAFSVDQTDNILIFAQNDDPEKDGIYLFDAGKKPLSFFAPLKRIALKKDLPAEIDLSSANVFFSPDFKQVIIDFSSAGISYLFSLDQENAAPFDVAASKQTLLEAWEEQKEKDQLKILETFPKEIAKIATDSFHLIAFSPNETKFLYQAKKSVILPLAIKPPLIASNQAPEVRNLKKDSLYIYDKKEDKNFEVFNLQTTGLNNQKNTSKQISNIQYPISNFIQWYPDSKHLVFAENKKIVVVDYDGQNKQTVYSGPFENYFFNVNSNGNLVILANFNPETNKFPDLYEVGIR